MRTQNPQYYSNSLPLPHREQISQERKFAEKSNALKKVAIDDLDDEQTNSISEGGFSWTNILSMYRFLYILFSKLVYYESTSIKYLYSYYMKNFLSSGSIMQMIFNAGNVGPNKSDSLDTDSVSPSPWANLLSMGFKILTALLGGGNNDGIDKVDNGSPMQV